MTFSQLCKKMRTFNFEHNIERSVDTIKGVKMVGEVVLKNNALNTDYGPYSKDSRTYTFSNYNKALTANDLGYSIFAYCKADKDTMRIEHYTDKDFESCRIISVEENSNF